MKCLSQPCVGKPAQKGRKRHMPRIPVPPQLLLEHTLPQRNRNSKQVLSLFLKRYKMRRVPGRLPGDEAQPSAASVMLQTPRQGADETGAKRISFFQPLGLAAWRSLLADSAVINAERRQKLLSKSN